MRGLGLPGVVQVLGVDEPLELAQRWWFGAGAVGGGWMHCCSWCLALHTSCCLSHTPFARCRRTKRYEANVWMDHKQMYLGARLATGLVVFV